jgi:hypothetical protein
MFAIKADPETWQALVSCRCGSQQFSCRYLGHLDGGLLCDFTDTFQRAELTCAICSKELLLFDATLNGYDVAIGEGPQATDECRFAKEALRCPCGGKTFEVAVEAIYDADPETVGEMDARMRNELFGWFTATTKCSGCGVVHKLIDYECA